MRNGGSDDFERSSGALRSRLGKFAIGEPVRSREEFDRARRAQRDDFLVYGAVVVHPDDIDLLDEERPVIRRIVRRFQEAAWGARR